MSFCCSIFSPAISLTVFFFHFNHSTVCETVSHCSNWYFPNDKRCWTYLYIFICLLYIFFGEVSVYIFSFLIGLFFILLSFNCSLYILYISLLSIVWFQIFSPSWTNSSQRVCGDLVLLLNWIRGKIWGNSSLALLCSWENHSQQAN